MAVSQFTKTIQSHVYKNWLKSLDQNIITGSAKVLRDREQVAQKTSFYISKQKIKEMYKTISGTDMDDTEAQLFLQELLRPFSSKSSTGAIVGTKIKVGNSDAVFFKNIGFDTISVKLSALFNSYPRIEESYRKAEEDYYNAEIAALRGSKEYKNLSLKDKKKAEAEVEKKAKERGTLGYYYNKGHVISVATNLVRQFKEEIEKADRLAKNEQKVLLDVLDEYIDRLVKDDLATANLPDAVNQELYAGYIKSSDIYLVEMQSRVTNIQSGSASVKIVEELRNLLNPSSTEFAKIINNSPALGKALLVDPGSPPFINLLAKDLVDILQTGKRNPKRYEVKPILIGKRKLKITKSSNKKEIQAAKKLKDKIVSSIKKDTRAKFKEVSVVQPQLTDLDSLLIQLNTSIQDQVKRNMGTGNRADILNYRTGRFAESVKVEKLSESRQGMITAFYSYMKYPYATFSQGGRQEIPRSRDPKLLISKSIREIAATLVGNRMRAVSL